MCSVNTINNSQQQQQEQNNKQVSKSAEIEMKVTRHRSNTKNMNTVKKPIFRSSHPVVFL